MLKHTPFLTLFLVACVTLNDSLAAETIIPGIETSQLDDHLKGRALIEEMNCVACHKAPAIDQSSRKSPRLSAIGARANHNYIKAFIAAPHETKPGTLMPDVLIGLSAEEKEKAATAITHFLVSLNEGDEFQLEAPDAVSAELGRDLFHSVGCVACHSSRNLEGDEPLSDTSVPLGDLELKYSQRSLVDFLLRPHDARPSGRMPDLQLPRHEIERIAHYLLRKTPFPGHLAYTTWRGKVWEGLSGDVEKEKAGMVDDFSLEALGENTLHHHTAIEYSGFLQVETAGDYLFHLELNGGSLRLNDKEVVALAPSDQRGPKKLTGTASLNSGWNQIALVYFHTGHDPRFVLEMEGPGLQRNPIPSSMLAVSDHPIPTLNPLQPNPSLASTGKQLFGRFGCVQCHDDVNATKNDYTDLKDLDLLKGCLEGSPGAPRFSLNEKQRKLIALALPLMNDDQLTDVQMVNKSLATLNCIACHERDGLGGISSDRKVYFTGTREALGDQGRFPPPLTHVGAKLTPQALEQILLHGGRQRTYLNTRMPLFGGANVIHLIRGFEKIDALEEIAMPQVTHIQESKEAGYHMMGTEGLSCIACHDFNGQESGGAGALDLVDVTQRLRKSWFHLYMRQPSRFHPTVIMPSYWPGGQPVRKDVLGGDTEQQIEALWAYLSDGVRAKNPKGLSRQSPELRVTNETLICRGRSPIGYRGIAIGYPERVSLAFDSEEMALRQLWKGEFANVDHGSFHPRGDNRISFAPGIPFHRLASLDDSWPYKGKLNYTFPQDHGYQFRGYFLDKQKRPTFQYHYGEIAINDYFEDILDEERNAYFKRTLVFVAPASQEAFYFRAATGQTISSTAQGWQIDNLNLHVTGDHPPAQIRRGDISELLIPLKLEAGTTTIQVDYKW